MNKTPNNNFLEDEEIEYEEVPEDQITDADEILEELEGEIEAESKASAQTLKALSEAEKRIEQANLYKAILNSSLFAKGSARPEIIKVVDKEFKEFVMFRLEVLLGIKSEGQRPGQATAVKSPFTDVEVAALKDIARKLAAKQAPTAPVHNQVAPTPVINQVAGGQDTSIQQIHGEEQSEPVVTAQKMVKRVVRRTQGGQPVTKKSSRAKTDNVSAFTGQDLSQARSTVKPPLPMPSNAHMNALNAEQAAKNARATGSTSPALATALNTLLK